MPISLNHLSLPVVFAAFLLVFLLNALSPRVQAEVQTYSQQQVLDSLTLEGPKVPVLLDVRSAEEFQKGHVPGAINIPHSEVATKIANLESYKDRPLVVYCRSGRRAGVALEVLKEKGFDQLAEMQGHMNLWQQNNLPTEP